MENETINKPLTKKAERERERQEAIDQLRKWLKPGDTIYTTLRHVSSSGMSRVIDMHILQTDARDGKPHIQWIGYLACVAMDDKWDDRKQGIKIGGCGMDMGFALVYNLGRTLWPEGFHTTPAQGKACPQCGESCTGVNYHRNGDYSGHDSDGGYALKHSWI